MKIKRYEGGDLRRVLAGMVTDRTVCSRIAGQWRDDGLFDAPWANLVGGWAVRHLREYGKPLGGQLQATFEEWADGTAADGDTIKAVERFLRALSDEYERQEPPPASDYLLDCAGKLFNKTRMRRVMDVAADDLDGNRVDKAYDGLACLTRVELGVGSLVKPAEDREAWRQAFDAEQLKPLVSYPNGMDVFLGREMVRDAFVSFMAPDKTGKSMWLLDLAYRAVRARHRAVYFDCGDNGQRLLMRRLGQRSARMPKRPGKQRMPVSVDADGNVEYKVARFKRGLEADDGREAFRRIVRGRDVLRLSCHPNSSINVAGIVSVLRDWEREGWVPDVVVVDYADILAPPAGVRDTLDQIDETWRHLRRLSQEMHCLVATATQSNALAYGGRQRVLGKRHFSGRKTKLAHVDGMVGLYRTPDDERRGITKVNWIVKRDGYYNESRWEVAAGCLAVCNPIMRARDRGGP